VAVGLRRVRRLDAVLGGAVTTPVASGTLYASVDDLRQVMAGTDGGTGTATQLTDEQLQLALYAASNRVSVYAGNIYDGSSSVAAPPPILHDLTLDLAVFWAAKTYLKWKAMEPANPVYIAYQNVMSILQDVRAGKILLDPAVAPGIGEETGVVINRLPPIFTGEDSNTRLGAGGVLQADVPPGMWAPMGADWGGATYQG
jgi:phage gp36-like protein